jgi:signal transduction histidine kinase
MTLVNRLSAYALGGLAVVLVSFSAALFGLAWVYLHRQADARGAAADHALVAAVEIHPGDVEWEPTERRIRLGQGDDLEEVRWTVHDAAGKLVDCSDNLTGGGMPEASGPWTVSTITVRAGQYAPESDEEHRPGTLEVSLADRGLEPPGQVPVRNPIHQSTALTLTVAVSRRPVVVALWRVGGVLAAASVGVWLLAALTTRRVCRRALRPVAVMAESCRAVGDDPSARLAVHASGDELEGLGGAFNALLARLHAAHERQRRFTGDAAHQLRTPLAALLGQVEVALRHDRPAPEYRRVLEVVGRRGGELQQVVESLLFLARADGCRRFDLEQTDLGGWLRERATGGFDHPRAGDVEFDVPDDPVESRVHVGLLGQVLGNLLDNALKYSEPGTPIRVRLEPSAGVIRLSVEDRGCGLGPNDIPRVGEPFFRTADARRRGIPGVGLGLAVVRRIAIALDGQLEVESEPGRGSRFTVVMPADGPAAADRPPGDELNLSKPTLNGVHS